MWIKAALLILFALGGGAATAGGYFAIIATVGVITRFAQYTHTAGKIRFYELMIICGAALGNVAFVFMPPVSFPAWLIVPAVLFMGVFTGCFLVSLAEALKGIPIFVRRVKLTVGLCCIIVFFALGKGLGGLFYFLANLASGG
mgnify:CR=1 FL=1